MCFIGSPRRRSFANSIASAVAGAAEGAADGAAEGAAEAAAAAEAEAETYAYDNFLIHHNHSFKLYNYTIITYIYFYKVGVFFYNFL